MKTINSNKISGIRSVDFILTATGEGVVNSNGSFPVYNPTAGKVVKNHVFPKMRGLDPMQRMAKDDASQMMFSLSDPAIASAHLIVSAECLRAAIFKDVSFGFREVTVENVDMVLSSLLGLVRGYLITEGGRNFSRPSPLLITDFDCAKPDLTFNQGTNSKLRGTDKESASLYSYFKTGKDLRYTGKATISVETLQFIPLEDSLGRTSRDRQVHIPDAEDLAKSMTEFLVELAAGTELKPVARFLKKAIRIGSISNAGDAGILLNSDAIRVVVYQVQEMLESLYIRQGKGYLQVTDALVDFNDGRRVFRMEDNPLLRDSKGKADFAVYYREQTISDADFIALQAAAKYEYANRDDVKKAKKEADKAYAAIKKQAKVDALSDAVIAD